MYSEPRSLTAPNPRPFSNLLTNPNLTQTFALITNLESYTCKLGIEALGFTGFCFRQTFSVKVRVSGLLMFTAYTIAL